MTNSAEGGMLYVVGMGPGSPDTMTLRAREVIEASEVIVGYTGYIKLLGELCAGKVTIASGMGAEIERCEAALREALLGRRVSLVSSGDAGIYGMAGPALEAAQRKGIERPEAIEIVPGVPAFVAAAACAGAPLMNDFASVSLSDLMNPWDKIEQKLSSAAEGDFVTCLYNPKSTTRTVHIERARDIFLQYRDAATPCAVVRNACRPGESLVLTTLGNLCDNVIDMHSTVIIGSSQTRILAPWMITPRGYSF